MREDGSGEGKVLRVFWFFVPILESQPAVDQKLEDWENEDDVEWRFHQQALNSPTVTLPFIFILSLCGRGFNSIWMGNYLSLALRIPETKG